MVFSISMGVSEPDPEFSKRAMSNLITEVLYVVIAAVIGLVMVPYYIDELGMVAYAIVPLATSVTSYVMIIADSFCSSVNRFLVVSLERGSEDEVRTIFSTSMFSILRIVLIVMPIMAILAYLSPMIFDAPDSSFWAVRSLFLMILWSALIVAVGSCFNNALIAKNKIYSINIARISYLVLQVGFIVLLFSFGTPKLEYIGLAYLISSLFYLVVSYVLMKLDFPWLGISLRSRDPAYLRDIDRLSVWSIVNRVGSLLFLQASLIMTNLFLGAYDEGSFSLVVSLVSMISTACMAIANVFNPFLFRYYSLDDTDSMVDTGRMGMRFLSLLLAMPLAFICMFSQELLTAWVGPEYVFLDDVIWVMFMFLTMQSSMSILDVVPTITLRIKGMALITVGFGILNLILATLFCLFTDWGLMGVAVAWAISMTLRGCVAYPIYISWTMGTDRRSFFGPQFVGAILFIVSVFMMYVLSMVITMPTSLISIILIFIVIYVVYLLISMRFVFRGKDKEMLLTFMPDRISELIARII